MVKNLGSDLRQGTRALLRRPVVTVAVVLSVVLGIGVNTAIFTVLDAIFLRPVPAIDDPEEIVYMFRTSREAPDLLSRNRFAHPVYRDYEERMETVSALAVGQRVSVHVTVGDGETQLVEAFGASPKYFEVLGIEPSLGRFFTPEEDQALGSHPVAVVSHGFWQRELGADPDVLGQRIRLDGQPYTIVGVGPRGFQGTEVHTTIDLWVPIMMWPSLSPWGQYFDRSDVSIFEVYGRIAPGSSLEAVNEETERLARNLEETYPTIFQHLDETVRAVPFRDVTILPRERENYERYGLALILGVVLVLLLCCINVACLLLVQGRDRARELATRQALGSPRSRLFRQLMLESLLLFFTGGVLAAAIAQALAELLWRYRPPQFAANAVELQLDASALAFLFLLTLTTGVLTGLVPAWRASRTSNLAGQLRSTGNPAASGGRPLSLRSLLVIPQITLALVALVAGGLYYQGLQVQRQGDLGFEPEGLVVMTVSPGVQDMTPAESRRFYDRLVSEVEAAPGVVRAGLSSSRLLRGAQVFHQVYREGEVVPPEGDDRPSWRTVTVSSGFFDAVGLEILRGRTFTTADGPDAPLVAIINEYMDETEWSDQSAVGERFRFDFPTEPLRQVVGVAENAKYRYLDEDPMYFLYLPLAQETPGSMVLHARVEGDAAASVTRLQHAVRNVDPDVPISEAGTMMSYLDQALWIERSATTLLNAFGLLCLLLAMVGVYGLTRYSVRRRRREIGIRMALGAQRGSVLQRFFLETTGTTLVGVVLGLILSFALVRPMVSREIPEIGWGSPWVYLLPGLLLLVTALAGAWMPARRASRLDPMDVLGTE